MHIYHRSMDRHNNHESNTLLPFDPRGSELNIVSVRFKVDQTGKSIAFSSAKGEEEYEGILNSPGIADVFEDFVIEKLLMNVKAPLLVNPKKELWKFCNTTIRAFVKEENA